MKKILNICGARPNFMKIAPLVHAMQRSSKLRSTIVHTGQHYSPTLSDVFFEELKIPRPEISLEVGSLSRVEQIALDLEQRDARFAPFGRRLYALARGFEEERLVSTLEDCIEAGRDDVSG